MPSMKFLSRLLPLTLLATPLSAQAPEHQDEVLAARDAYEQAKNAFANSLAINLDVLTAQDQLLNSELQLTGARFDRTVFYLDLVRATGRMGDVTGSGKLSPAPATRPAKRAAVTMPSPTGAATQPATATAQPTAPTTRQSGSYVSVSPPYVVRFPRASTRTEETPVMWLRTLMARDSAWSPLRPRRR